MSEAIGRLKEVGDRIRAAVGERGPGKSVVLVAVSKTFDADSIRPVIAAGARVFGENKVQEAQGKWPGLKVEFPDVELHLLGPLQSNKAGDAVALFDVIQSVDREKIAAAIAKEAKDQGRNPQLFIQVNIGEEPQKAGIAPEVAEQFVQRCRTVYGLQITGLMCIPPAGEDPVPFFERLSRIGRKAGVGKLSMGMSGDFETAILHGADYVRVGSAIFGKRPVPTQV